MEYKRIDELTTVVTGGTPSTAVSEYWENGSIPWLQSGCCQNCDVNSTEKYITQLGLDNSSARMMPIDTVMIALTGATAGKIGYLNFEACGNQSITGIFPCEELNQRFLYYYLISLRPKILSDCVGGAQAHISQGYVKNIRVPVFSLEKQSKIAECLNKAQSIIDYRQKQLQSLDDLIKARFVEMFGDPIKNEKAWEVLTLNKACDGIGDGLHGTPEYDDCGEYPFINGNNLIDGAIRITPATKMVSKETYNKHYIEITDNAILLSINGTLGKLALYNGEKVMLGKSACYCNIKPNINRKFVYGVMKTNAFADFLESNATASTIKNVGLKAIRDFKLIIPPVVLQLQYVEFAEQIDKSKSVVQKALDEAQLLFDSLMQKYFG